MAVNLAVIHYSSTRATHAMAGRLKTGLAA